jgi:Tol biopolymer transport system component
MDAQTGRLSAILTQDRGGIFQPEESPDGRTLYYRIAKGAEGAIVKRDLASGDEKELIRRTGLNGFSLSPDGKYIAFYGADPKDQSNTLLLLGASGGEVRELMRRPQPQIPALYAWGPDGTSLLARIVSNREQSEIWRAPLDGSAAVKLSGTVGPNIRAPRLAPGGSRIVYQVNEPPKPAEIWVTENFLPKI